MVSELSGSRLRRGGRSSALAEPDRGATLMSGGWCGGEPEFLYLTTTGRRSGQPREIEIWFTSRDGRYYLHEPSQAMR